MKLLFDQNLSPRLVELLENTDPDSTHVQSVKLDRANDEEVWRFAGENGYVIVSKDADYYERSLLFGHPPNVVWIRRGNCSTTQIEDILRTHSAEIESLPPDGPVGCLVLV
ncbi:MAG: DUF5615 family PIN-like protein [Pyrinomonadaceae bacterium]